MNDDAVAGVVQAFDGTGGEQDAAAMAGAVDGEHASTVRTKWIVGKVQFKHLYAYQFW